MRNGSPSRILLMCRIVNDNCDFCNIDLSFNLIDKIKSEKRHWFGKSGQLLAKYSQSYLNRLHQGFLASSRGPRLVWESYCVDCATPCRICADHLREILSVIENREKDTHEFNGISTGNNNVAS